jgi:hypothetical protein
MAIVPAAAAGEPSAVIYDLMRGFRSAAQAAADGVLSSDPPASACENLELLDGAVQDVARERRQEGFVLRMASGDRVATFDFAPPPAPS